MCNYPLYDIPWLVRQPNEKYNSQKRYLMERKNQSVVDTYFILRDQGLPAIEAQRQTAQKHQPSNIHFPIYRNYYCSEVVLSKTLLLSYLFGTLLLFS
jgi:hypothetical protein